jgi:hypothetical protein
MSLSAGPGQRRIRVGNCSGFYGDRASAMADMARAGGIDVLTGDYLAEVTMLILGKARAKDPTKGYAATFLLHLDAALERLVANRIRLVVNAGGLNPDGLATATRDLIARHGHELRVAHVDGDDVFSRLDALQQAGHPLAHLTSGEPLTSWPHQPLTANAYLGGFGIARALDNGADIVITGRVTDASVVVGAAAWWWSWTPRDYDALAGAVCAGHVIECGPQATGGNFSGFPTIPDLIEPGFPIAEIAADGSCQRAQLRLPGAHTPAHSRREEPTQDSMCSRREAVSSRSTPGRTPLPWLRSLATETREARAFIEEFTMAGGQRIYLIADGRLVNLSAAEGHPALVMDMSFANQALSAEYAIQNAAELERKVYPVPAEIDNEIARLKLETMGVDIDKLTEEQEKYLASWDEGT